jgi:hypothetical protein
MFGNVVHWIGTNREIKNFKLKILDGDFELNQ